eukprot:1158313-Pelagomonas_calceolata.AAC.3
MRMRHPAHRIEERNRQCVCVSGKRKRRRRRSTRSQYAMEGTHVQARRPEVAIPHPVAALQQHRRSAGRQGGGVGVADRRGASSQQTPFHWQTRGHSGQARGAGP